MKTILFVPVLALLLSTALAQDVAPVPEPPPLPEPMQSGEPMEPEVTITESEKGTIHQYSHNGRVYMVKIVPDAGPPYYLLDSNGDGTLDVLEDDPTNVAVPQWVIFSW